MNVKCKVIIYIFVKFSDSTLLVWNVWQPHNLINARKRKCVLLSVIIIFNISSVKSLLWRSIKIDLAQTIFLYCRIHINNFEIPMICIFGIPLGFLWFSNGKGQKIKHFPLLSFCPPKVKCCNPILEENELVVDSWQ